MAIFPGLTDEGDQRVWSELAAALGPKYQLLKPLGHGGMGAVLLAREPALDRNVAIKVLAPPLASNEFFRQRFEIEGRAAAAISHPNVVQVYTVGETAGEPPLPFMILQYVEGHALDDWLRQFGPASETQTRRLLREIAAGLAAAHERHLVHLDVKPGNVLVEQLSGRAMLVDFGLAAALSHQLPDGTRRTAPDDNRTIGTPLYMSPEQMLGDPVGPKSDVFSFGLLAGELLTGTPPSGSISPAAMLHSRLTRPAPLAERAGIPRDVGRLIDQCVDPDPDRRPTAASVARALNPAADDGVTWPPPGLGHLPALGRRLRVGSLAASIGIALLAATIATKVAGTHTAHGWWRAWGEGTLVISAATAPSEAGVVAWQLMVVLSVVLIVVGLLRIASQSGGAVRDLAIARSRGWRWETLLDALGDPDGRTGQVLSAAGDFATLSEAARHRVRDCRRQSLGAPLVAVAWLAGVAVWWAANLASGRVPGPLGGPLLDGWSVAILIVPPLAALIVWISTQVRERRAVGSIPWRRLRTPPVPTTIDPHPSVVAGWYVDLGGPRGPSAATAAPRRWVPRGIAMLVFTTVLVVLVGSIWTATATLVVARLAGRVGPATARVAPQIDSTFSTTSVLGLSGRNGSAGPSFGTEFRDLAAYPIDPRQTLGSADPGIVRRTFITDAVRRAHTLSPDAVRQLAIVANHPRTLALREAARKSGSVPQIDESSLAALRQSIEANAAGAVWHIAMRRPDSARQRLAENATAATWMLGAPGRIYAETGLLTLETAALLPLAELERSVGDSAKAAEFAGRARQVASLSARFGPGWSVGTLGLASDPRSLTEFEAVLADTTIPVGYRLGVVESFRDALCLRPRYLLIGEVVLPPSVERLKTRADENGFNWGLQRIRYCFGIGRLG